MRMIAAALAALALAGPALAETDTGAVSTASQTDELIAEWLKAPAAAPASAGSTPFELAAPLRDGKVHGEVGFAVGNHGYREAYGMVDIPLGQHGDAVVAVSDARGQGFGGVVHGRSVGVGLLLGEAGRAAPLQAPDCAALRSGRDVEPSWVAQARMQRPGGLAACPGAPPE